MRKGCIKNANYYARMYKTIKFMLKFAEDLLILGGLMLIVSASYKINAILGQYVLGIILLLLGFIATDK